MLGKDPNRAYVNLYIYLAIGPEPIDSSRPPTFFKKDLMVERILGLASKNKRSLVIKYGCGGCSNDYETTLTIAHIGGEFLVAGFTLAWDTRNGIGSCDINFLTGKGVVSRGLAKSKPIKEKFAPIKLADWSVTTRPAGCIAF